MARLICLCLSPLLILAVVVAFYHVQFLKKEYDRDAQDRLHHLATSIDRHLGTQITALQVLAGSPLLDDPSRFMEFYRQAQIYRDTIGGQIILADLSTQMLLNTRTPFGSPLSKLPQPKGHAAVPVVLATGKPAVGDMFHGPIAREGLVAIVVPVVRNQRTKYLLLSTMETRRLQEDLDEVSLPTGWSLTVLDGKDEVLARRGAPATGKRPSSGSPGFYSAKSKNSHWTFLLEISNDVYRAPIAIAAGGLATAILVATLLGMIVGRASARQLANAVAALTGAGPPTAARPIVAEIETARTFLNESVAALRESEARYRELFKSNPHPMWVYDLETLAFLAVNNAAIATYGYSREEFLAMTIRDIRPTDDLAKLDESVHHVSGPLRRMGLWTHRWKSGTLRSVEIVTHDLNFAGRPARLVLANDVTERLAAVETIHRLNEELEQKVEERTRDYETTAEELEAANENLREELEARLRMEESLLAASTELEEKNAELERLNRLFVGRELRMRELKNRIAELEGAPPGGPPAPGTGKSSS